MVDFENRCKYLEAELRRIIERAKQYNGLIKTEDDLFKHMDRLQKCTLCKIDFYDKFCPECSQNRKTSYGCKKELNIPGDKNNIKCGEGILCSDCSPSRNLK